jgi:hypothetical protein
MFGKDASRQIHMVMEDAVASILEGCLRARNARAAKTTAPSNAAIRPRFFIKLS